jgi:hypothetical protein
MSKPSYPKSGTADKIHHTEKGSTFTHSPKKTGKGTKQTTYKYSN